MPKPVASIGRSASRPLRPLQPVFAIAQESEMAILHPCKQRAGFAQIGRDRARAQGSSDRRAACRAASRILPQSAQATRTSRMLRSIWAASECERGGIDDAVHFDVLERFEPLLRGLGTVFFGASPRSRKREQAAGGVARHRKHRDAPGNAE